MGRGASAGRSALGLGSALLLWGSLASAADQARERNLTPEEIEAWLDSRAMPAARGDRGGDDEADAPPPPPRGHGFVLESSLGVLGHLGHMKNISPAAPRFGLRFGYEPLAWLMLFIEADLFVASTSYARPPPPARTYAFWNVGAGLRFTLRPSDRFGLYLQGSMGGGRATEDVLEVYGYQDSAELNIYAGSELGLEWYQINPHLALALHGGVRHYGANLKRERDTEPPLAWLGGAALRYKF
jgi:hypothetical protein